ncbi:ran GTPase activating protein 1 [Viridothelium virens]|uniref:Ran GTPase activating protein 1 n=1 Tax=Viridothelium virens TaxID=1048519 RepID=A0A6A6HJD6_VIRVR|nr:ran GTPase activating protein 1 [Viridothelium virens]
MASPKLFTLEGKGLKLDSEADIEPHIKDLKASNDFEEIRLQGNTIGVDASKALAPVLSSQKNLQIANFADIFTGRLLHEIPAALSTLLTALLPLPHLHTLNLSDNAFGFNTQAPLIAFLSAHTPLRHLILTNNGLGPEAGAKIAEALTTLAAKKTEAREKGEASTVPPLETVVCGRNRLESGSMTAWAKTFEANSGVLEVKMVQNGIRQEGISLLLKNGLRHAKGLRVLDLQDNTFTAMGARALSEVVGGWTELRELGVSDCLVSARGAVLLFEKLREGANAELEVLRCQYGEVDAKGLKVLAEAQDKLPKLRRIELNGNKFDEDDPAIETLREKLQDRKEKAESGVEEGEEDYWGIDDLDDLEEVEDEEEDEEEPGDVDAEDEADKEIKQADEAENENVSQKRDTDVDALADKLGKTSL